MMQLVLMLPLIWKIGIRLRPRWPLDHPGVKQVLRLFGPAVFGAGIYQINVLVSTVIAGRLEEGSVAVLSYSARLVEVVLGVFVFALSTVSLTSLSRQAADNDMASFRSTLIEVLRWVVFITIPSGVGLYFLRRPVLYVLLYGGAFDERSLNMAAFTFQYHILGLTFVGLSRVIVNAFYARKDVKTPVRVAAVSLIANLVLAWYLSESPLSYAGIALAASLSAFLHLVVLVFAFQSKVSGFRWTALLNPVAQASVPAAIMGAGVWWASRWLTTEQGKMLLGLQIAGVILGGALVYFAVARVMGIPEAKLLVKKVLRRGRKP